MEEFYIHYWFDRHVDGEMEMGNVVHEKLTGASLDEVTKLVQERLKEPSFAVSSLPRGHTVIQSANVRFCQIRSAAEEHHARGH